MRLVDITAESARQKQELLEYWNQDHFVDVTGSNKGLFGKNRAVPFGHRFCCENAVLSILKQKEKVHLYGGDGTEQLYPNWP